MARKTVGLGVAIALLVIFSQSVLAQDNYQTDTEETLEAGRATIGGPIYAYVSPAYYDITVTGTTPEGVSMYQFEYYNSHELIGHTL